MRNLTKYHNCEKCHGKIVLISIDAQGNTRCGYCNEVVHYPIKNVSREDWNNMLKRLKEKKA